MSVTMHAREVYFSVQPVVFVERIVQLADEIQTEAQEPIRRRERYAQALSDEFTRRNGRTGQALAPVVLRPAYWV